MKNCKECGKEISDKYEYCFECNKKFKENKNTDMNDWFSKINNNLYHIICQLDIITKENHGKKVKWSKELKDFEAVKA